jgi:hypothetical protein
LKAIFITTTNLASNPRLTKELELALSHGYQCTVLQFYLGNWSDSMTKIQKESKFKEVNFIELDATRGNFKLWLFSSILEKMLSRIPMNLQTIKLLSFSLSKRSFLIYRELKKVNTRYDWVIAHNPGAFFPALDFSLKIESKLGIDVEDYHPGETNDRIISNRVLRLMEKTLKKTNYVSFAAPLIQKEVESNFNTKFNGFTIINGFPSNEFISPKDINNEKLKLVWFSQNISLGRGLEKLIPAINKLEKEVELHLIGNYSPDVSLLLNSKTENIIIHKPMSQKELHSFLGDFDIGLAFDPMLNKNRELAITNKIIAYAQAGLHILCVESMGQRNFLEEYSINGTVVNFEHVEIENAILKLIGMKTKIRKQKINQFETAKKIAWEEINSSLIKSWNS